MKFKTKSKEVQAYQMGHDGIEWIRFANNVGRSVTFQVDGSIDISSLEGSMKATLKDWIIIDDFGNVYPLKDDVFKQKYEKRDD